MSLFNRYIGQQIDFEISGDKKRYIGTLVDVGSDIIVVFEETKFLYIPLHHIQHLTIHPKLDSNNPVPQLSSNHNGEATSFSSTLNNARQFICEIYLSDHQTMHGFITDIQTDYFIFASPFNKTLLIPFFHLKWISPNESTTPYYSFTLEQFVPLNFTLSPTFAEQLKQQEGSIIILDEGLNSRKIGLLQKFENHILELVTADEKSHYYHVQHIKNVCIR